MMDKETFWTMVLSYLFALLLMLAASAAVAHAQTVSLTLGWQDNSNNETGFQLQTGPPEGPFKDAQAFAANTTSAVVSGLDQAKQYCFKLGAFNAAGRSAFIGPTCATTSALLTLTKAGAGQGTITSAPAGFSCGSKCAGPVPGNLTLALTATPEQGSKFAAWGGACSGVGNCNLTMDGPKTVMATFEAGPVTFPLVLEKPEAQLPEEITVSIPVTLPAEATRSFIVLETYDPDYPNEGQLVINGKNTIQIFGTKASSANQEKTMTVEYEVPVNVWVNGGNTLRFTHVKTLGYKIHKATVRFETPTVPPSPNNFTVTGECKLDAELENGSCAIILKKAP